MKDINNAYIVTMKKYSYYFSFFKNIILLITMLLLVVSCEESNIRDGLRTVNFKASADRTLITEGESITYIDSSLSVTSRRWDFEGGNIDMSEEQEVEVLYNEASPSEGEGAQRRNRGFLTNLEVVHEDGSVESRSFTVSVFQKVVPQFVADNTIAVFGSSIQFVNTTEDGESAFAEAKEEDTILWEFEGGTPATSTQQDPVVTYNTPGKYPVKLTIFRNIPESTGITTVSDFIEIISEPVCDNSINLVDCGNNDGEGDSVVGWQAVLSDGTDRSFKLSVSDEQASEGDGSIKFMYNEGDMQAFTNNDILFNEVFEVTEAGNYKTTLDVYADLISTTNPDFVLILAYRNADDPLTHIQSTEAFNRQNGGAWHSLENSKNLTPGRYILQLRTWNPPWHQDLDMNLFIDNIEIVRE